MKIGIDARFFGPEGTGIGRYVENLLKNLEEIDQESEYFVFLKKSNFPLYNPKNKNFHKFCADAHWYSLKEQVIMPAALMGKKLDLVHFPHVNIPLLYQGKFVVTIHDLTKVIFRSQASGKKAVPVQLSKQVLYDFTFNQALSRSAKVLVPSSFVKNELKERFAVAEEKIVVTYEAADDFKQKNLDVSEGRRKEILGKFGIRRNFILTIGNSFPYKNLGQLIQALPEVSQEVQLVLVSKRDDWLEKIIAEAKELGVAERLVVTGFVPDKELVILLKEARLLAFPSLSEGFGLPGLEAMSVGCPVVAASTSSLPEVYADAAIYFDPSQSRDIADKINRVLGNSTLAKNLVKKGLIRSQEFSWRKTALETLKVYQNLVNE